MDELAGTAHAYEIGTLRRKVRAVVVATVHDAIDAEAAAEAKRATGLLFPVYSVAEHTARSLRDWLRRAEVKRAELHRASDTHKNITFHDLRTPGLTWMTIRGDDPLKIQQRARHVDSTRRRSTSARRSRFARASGCRSEAPGDAFEWRSGAWFRSL